MIFREEKPYIEVMFSGRRKFFFVFLWFLVLAGFFPQPAEAGLTRVWAVDDGEKVMKQDTSNILATSGLNKVWQGETVNLFGAKNEIIAFQLILQGDSSGLNNVKVELPLLKQTGGSYSIDNSKAQDADDPFNYVGKRIEVFVEHYQNIRTRTSPTSQSAWGFSGAQGNYLGYVPDALIPVESPKFSGGFTVEANKNQGVWFDLYLPKDAPAGTYTGTITVKSGSTTVKTVPVNLTVYGFTLPDETHLKSFAFFAPYSGSNFNSFFGTSYLSGTSYYQVEKRYHQLMHRHRMDLSQNLTSSLVSSHPYFKGYLTGASYTTASGYDGPAVAVGDGVAPLGVYDSFRSGFTGEKADWQAAAKNWVEWFDENAPEVDYFVHLPPDEAKPDYLADLVQKGEWIKEASNLKTFATTIGFILDEGGTSLGDKWQKAGCGSYLGEINVRDDLGAVVDLWGVNNICGYFHEPGTSWGGTTGRLLGWVTKMADKVRAEGNDVVVYNGTYPYMGTNLIDADATHQRVNPWIFWKYGVNYYFYYHANLYNDNNPFTDNYYYSSSVYRHGLGNYLYPGQDLKSGESAYNYGLAGPMASIRLKNWRRGQQDYEYLWLAKRAGKTSAAAVIVDRVVPKAACDLPPYAVNGLSVFNDPAPWANRGYSFEEARRELAVLIGGDESTIVPTATPAPTETPVPTVTSVPPTVEPGKANLTVKLLLEGVYDANIAKVTAVKPVTVSYRLNGGEAQMKEMAISPVAAGPEVEGEGVKLYIWEGRLTGLTPGSYQFLAEIRGHLARKWGTMNLASGENILDAAQLEKMLLGGDALDDERVNSQDTAILVGDYGAVGESEADFNFDGKVNSLDFSYISTNYSAVGQVLGEKVFEGGRREGRVSLVWEVIRLFLDWLGVLMRERGLVS